MVTLLASAALALALAGGADLATTEWALSRPGLREGNPAMSHPAVRVGAKVAAVGAVTLAHRELERRGKRKAAKALLWSAVGLWAGAAAWNVAQVQRAKR